MVNTSNPIQKIDPVKLFGNFLCSVQNPSVYIGGETGAVKKNDDSLFNFAIAFPDVYSIGMSNQAVKIIYNALNSIDCVRCERVFAVEKDFEDLLKKFDAPLYTLESGIPLFELDMIGFSIGYELGITGVLSILDLGRVPLLKSERTENDPIVIAGGCGATNPAPFSTFFDAIFIGEAEGGMFELIEKLALMKKNGATRSEILSELAKNPHVWTSEMSKQKCGHEKAFRAVWADFGKTPSVQSFLPLPSTKPVQNHGVVEIMRGCPNGCRFCHAGIYYRPQRVKSRELIFREVEQLVEKGGYREISLTSLSSADYPQIETLLDDLNKRFDGLNVSFQLPSLKVNSFSLPLLEKIAKVRKSSLTFAVETPDEEWQLMLNKEVYAQHLVEIILDAKKRGWNRAKFYFMVGLPFPEVDGRTEERAIVDFMLDLQNRTRIQCSVNVGVFIPKSHTAYQWARQISIEEAEKKLTFIQKNLPRGKFVVGSHNVFSGVLEGLLSRGDERAGRVILSAYKKGARLDAWENHLRENQAIWESAFDEADFDIRKEIFRERDFDETLPWDCVSLGPSKSFFKTEWQKHKNKTLTKKCDSDCDHKCGVCGDKIRANTKNLSDFETPFPFAKKISRSLENIPVMYRVVFSFSKKNGGEYLSHLSLVELFNRAILQSSLPAIYTAGFNPIPRLEFATTLSIGIRSDDEIASILLFENVSESDFLTAMNKNLACGIKIERCKIVPVSNKRRRESLASALWGGLFDYDFKISHSSVRDFFESAQVSQFRANKNDFDFSLNESRAKILLSFPNDRPFRNCICAHFDRPLWEIAEITKRQTFAKSISTKSAINYFDLYDEIAKINISLINS